MRIKRKKCRESDKTQIDGKSFRGGKGGADDKRKEALKQNK